jgi:hypothetical protein
MSSVYVILVVMFLFNPADRNGDDMIELISINGKPLYFETAEKCMEHIGENHLDIARFAIEHFMPKPTMVRGIICVEKEKEKGVGV